MIVAGEAKFVSVKNGIKNGKEWHCVKVLDEEAEEFCTFFVGQELYEAVEGLPKKTPLILTLHIVPGQKFCRLENIEIVSNS